jgi:hypothetical protein
MTEMKSRETPEKAELSTNRTDAGITIDFSPLSRNAVSSIRSNREPLSKVTDRRDAQRKKLDFPKSVTDDGISIDVKPVLANANSSICSNLEPIWNVTE